MITAAAGDWFHEVIWGGLVQTLYQLVYIALPLFGVALLLHELERIAQQRLSSRFGWNSILWTGWLGTPIHELSHAAFCPVFRHRITEMALFKPDRESGRMGYVHHAYNPKNYYQVVGNFFIGTAPLLGGALALYGLLWLFEPDAARRAMSADGMSSAIAGGNLIAAGKALWSQAWGVLSRVVTLQHLASLPFWLFLYLTLCVGSHLAPSRADYRGTPKGGLILLIALTVFNLLFLMFGGKPGGVTTALAWVTGPVLALFALCALLCGLSTLVVYGLTELVGPRRRSA